MAALIAVAALSGCATPPENDPEAMTMFREINDPLEPLNRDIFKFNVGVDKVLLRPTAYVYKEAVPSPLRLMIRNFLSNLSLPVVFANDLLQFEFERAATTLTRFAVNSSFGFIGAADVATEMGFPEHSEDLGQTLAVHGAGEGPYLMLPILGPSNPRDLTGFIGDIFLDPFTYVVDTNLFGLGRTVVGGIDQRAQYFDQIDELERTSIDYYATIRSLYRQRRNDEIRNGRPPPVQPLPEFQDNGNDAAFDGAGEKAK